MSNSTSLRVSNVSPSSGGEKRAGRGVRVRRERRRDRRAGHEPARHDGGVQGGVRVEPGVGRPHAHRVRPDHLHEDAGAAFQVEVEVPPVGKQPAPGVRAAGDGGGGAVHLRPQEQKRVAGAQAAPLAGDGGVVELAAPPELVAHDRPPAGQLAGAARVAGARRAAGRPAGPADRFVQAPVAFEKSTVAPAGVAPAADLAADRPAVHGPPVRGAGVVEDVPLPAAVRPRRDESFAPAGRPVRRLRLSADVLVRHPAADLPAEALGAEALAGRRGLLVAVALAGDDGLAVHRPAGDGRPAVEDDRFAGRDRVLLGERRGGGRQQGGAEGHREGERPAEMGDVGHRGTLRPAAAAARRARPARSGRPDRRSAPAPCGAGADGRPGGGGPRGGGRRRGRGRPRA